MKHRYLSGALLIITLPIATTIAWPVSAAPAAEPAILNLDLAVCTGVTVTFDFVPGLLLLNKQDINFKASGNGGICALLLPPTQETLTIPPFSGQGNLSCAANEVEPLSGSFKVNWGNRSTSTVKLDNFEVTALAVVTLVGHVTEGRFEGAMATIALAVDATKQTDCAKSTGLQHVSSLGTLTIAKLLN
jgi:hypothetical protein